MRRSMESIAANAVFFILFIGHGIGERLRWHRLMERRIEHMRQAAANLEGAGLLDMSRDVFQSAEKMERDLIETVERRRQDEHAREAMPLLHEILEVVHQLRGEVGELRKEVHELRERLDDDDEKEDG